MPRQNSQFAVIARSDATKQSSFFLSSHGLLRCARNDDYSLNPERGERVSDVIGRFHMNRGQAPGPRAFDVLGEIIEEHDTRGGNADPLHAMSLGRRVPVPKPDR